MSLTTTDRRILRLALPHSVRSRRNRSIASSTRRSSVGWERNSSAALRLRSRSCRSSSPDRTSSPTGRRSVSRTGWVPMTGPVPPTSASRRSGSRCSSGSQPLPCWRSSPSRSSRSSVPATRSCPSPRPTCGSPRSASRSCSSALPRRERNAARATIGRRWSCSWRPTSSTSSSRSSWCSDSTSELPEPRGRPWLRR